MRNEINPITETEPPYLPLASTIRKCLLVSVLFAVIASGCSLNNDSQLMKYSPSAAVASNESWPPFFKDIERIAISRGLNTASFKVQEVAWDEFFFECSESEGVLSMLVSEWKMTEVRENDKRVQKFLKRMPEEHSEKNCTFYANPNAIDGEKGVLLTMRHSKSTEAIIVHYYYNF